MFNAKAVKHMVLCSILLKAGSFCDYCGEWTMPVSLVDTIFYLLVAIALHLEGWLSKF